MRKQVTLRQFALKALPLVLLALPMSFTQVQAQGARATQPGQFADGIAAIVGSEVITMRQLQERMNANRISGNDDRGQAQILQGMIDELLVEDEALRLGLRVSDGRLNQVISEIAGNNNMTPEQLREAANQYGINWEAYVEGIRQQVLLDEVQRKDLNNMGIKVIQDNLVEVKNNYIRHDAKHIANIIINLALSHNYDNDK